MATLRTFIAITLTDEIRRWIAQEVETLKAPTQGVRWVSVDHMHLTLRFLGDLDEARLSDVGEAVDSAASDTDPFEIRPGRFGAFPDFNRPRVLWIGVEGDLKSLKELHGRVEIELARRGFAQEDRAFSPHLTLGRALRNRRVILPPIPDPGIPAPSMLAREVLVMKSELRPAGPIHTPMSRTRFRET